MRIKLISKKNTFLIIISLVLVLIGYLAYNYKEDSFLQNKIADIGNYKETLGDVQLVTTENVYIENSSNVDSTNLNEIENESYENVISENNLKNDYFEESRLERDKMFSETLEVYENILSNDSMSEEQKVIAENEIAGITNTKNGILVAENLIKAKGFEDVVIFVNDATCTVIVKAEGLEKEHISQIQNIVFKQLNIEISNISIQNREE